MIISSSCIRELCFFLLLFKFSYAIWQMFILLMYFRFGICKAFDSVLLRQIYIHCNIKDGNQRVWERWMKPFLLSLQTLSFRITKMSNGDPGWVKRRIVIFHSHFPDRFLEIGKKCDKCHRLKLSALCMCARVQTSLREIMWLNPLLLSAWETDALLFFEVVWPLIVPQQKAEWTLML